MFRTTSAFRVLIPGAVLTLASSLCAQPSTLGGGNSYAWAANLGWIEGTPSRPSAGDGFRFGEFACAGYLWSSNVGWIHCGDGTPENGVSYGNDGPSDYGVNHQGNGELYGLAWSANVGWINFSWWTQNPSDPNRPRVDLRTGVFSGHAWSANCGWISLGTGILKTSSMAIVDADGDGISDAFEIAYSGTLGVMGPGTDSDGDGFDDRDEYLALTNPLRASDLLRLTDIQLLEAGATRMSLTWTSHPSRLYVVESSIDLGVSDPWMVSPLDPSAFTPDAGLSTTRITLHPLSSPRRFFRVRPLVPLQP